jgi:hypothetical protein
MDLAENRFGKTWKHFLEVLKVDYNCSLADVCRDIRISCIRKDQIVVKVPFSKPKA